MIYEPPPYATSNPGVGGVFIPPIPSEQMYRNINTGQVISGSGLTKMVDRAAVSTPSQTDNARAVNDLLSQWFPIPQRMAPSPPQLIGGVRPPDYQTGAPKPVTPPPRVMPGISVAPALCECPTQLPPALPEKVVKDMIDAINAREEQAKIDFIGGVLRQYLEGVAQGVMIWRLVADRKRAERFALALGGRVMATPPAGMIPVPILSRGVRVFFEVIPLEDGIAPATLEGLVRGELPGELQADFSLARGVEIANTPTGIARMYDVADRVMSRNNVLVSVSVDSPPAREIPAPGPSPGLIPTIPAPGIPNCSNCQPYFIS